MAEQARSIYDRLGEEPMLRFIRQRRNSPEIRNQTFSGYAVLEDRSTITVSQGKYEFNETATREVNAQEQELIPVFERDLPLYRGWPNTATLWKRIMDVLEERISGRLSTGSNQVYNEAHGYSKWPQLEGKIRDAALNGDPLDRVFNEVNKEETNIAKCILAALDDETMKDITEAVRMRMKEENRAIGEEI